MKCEKLAELIGALGSEKHGIVEKIKNSDSEEISDLNAAKKFIDDVYIPMLQRISWELDTMISEDKIKKILA